MGGKVTRAHSGPRYLASDVLAAFKETSPPWCLAVHWDGRSFCSECRNLYKCLILRLDFNGCKEVVMESLR